MAFIRVALAGILLSTTVACSGAGPTSPSPESATPAARPGRLVLDVWSVEASRWGSTGAYIYDVKYRFHNQLTETVTATVAEAALMGPDGEPLAGTINPGLSRRTITVGPQLYSAYYDLTVDDDDASHPYAEHLRLTASYQVGSGSGTADAVAPVLHGPQNARLLEFTVEPSTPRVGDTITVRWNVQSARRVFLRTPISWDPNRPETLASNFDQQVEPVGSRSFLVRRSGLTFVTIDADFGLISKSITLVPR